MFEKYIGILGGSFNPPHIGHMRMAIEATEQLGFNEIWFLPCAVHPQKPSSVMLPFELRKSMLQETISILPNGSVCDIENELPFPSYTIDTLKEIKKSTNNGKLAFILGCEDFMVLSTWNRWADLVIFADLVVMPRAHAGLREFHETARQLWPDATASVHPISGAPTYYPVGGGLILYLDQPRLEVSSSLIRERFLERRSIDYLITSAVKEILRNNRELVAKVWNNSTAHQK